MKKLFPIIFLILGLGVGVGAGAFLAPGEKKDSHGDPENGHQTDSHADTRADESHAEKGDASHGATKDEHGHKAAAFDYLKLTKQFVVPVVEDDKISALVMVSLSLETRPGISEEFYEVEPKLRDSFLQVLFDHANIGGFNGAFTSSSNLELLRKSLLEAAKKELGDDVNQVLIMSVSRQDT